MSTRITTIYPAIEQMEIKTMAACNKEALKTHLGCIWTPVS
jgi:hypothetical protein